MSALLMVFAFALAQGPGAAAAAPQKPAAATPAPSRAAADAAVECRNVTPTGSNVSKSICATAAEWRQMRRESLEANREMTDRLRDAQSSRR